MEAEGEIHKPLYAAFVQETDRNASGLPNRRHASEREKEQRENILVIALYQERLHTQDHAPRPRASLPSLPALGWHLNANTRVTAAVVLIHYFPILSGLMSEFFDVSYLHLRTMGEDERG